MFKSLHTQPVSIGCTCTATSSSHTHLVRILVLQEVPHTLAKALFLPGVKNGHRVAGGHPLTACQPLFHSGSNTRASSTHKIRILFFFFFPKPENCFSQLQLLSGKRALVQRKQTPPTHPAPPQSSSIDCPELSGPSPKLNRCVHFLASVFSTLVAMLRKIKAGWERLSPQFGPKSINPIFHFTYFMQFLFLDRQAAGSIAGFHN